MSKYSTGEMAKLCNVSVRTVQYYDSKDLLKPSEITEGGRRVYCEDDLKTMRLICLLKSLGLSLNSIKGILSSENRNNTLLLLLDEHLNHIDGQINDMKRQKEAIAYVKDDIVNNSAISVNSINDIEKIMSDKNKMRPIYAFMIVAGIIMDIIEVATIVLWVSKGIWWPFAVGMPIVILLGCVATYLYYNNAAYICPECHTKFKPRFWQFFFCMHTFKTRKMNCPNCGVKSWCVETHKD